MLEKIYNDNKEEYCDVTKESTPDSTILKRNKNVKNILNQKLSNSDEERVDILTNLEQSGSLFNIVVSGVHLKNDSNSEFAKQGSDQANGSNLIENQECEQISQFWDSITERSRLKFSLKRRFRFWKKGSILHLFKKL